MSNEKRTDCKEKRKHPQEIMFMVNRLSRIFQYEMRKLCEENGVPVGYRNLLFHLVHNNGCSQRTLAERTGLKPSTISITLDKMERDGYVSRERNSMDQRAVRVFLTEKGMQIDRANRAKIDELDAHFSATVSAEEKVQLVALLEKVMDGYCAQQGWDHLPFCGHREDEE